jgi:hypothetical protein
MRLFRGIFLIVAAICFIPKFKTTGFSQTASACAGRAQQSVIHYFPGCVPLHPSSLQSLLMISKWSPMGTRRSGEAYPGFQSAAPTHQL